MNDSDCAETTGDSGSGNSGSADPDSDDNADESSSSSENTGDSQENSEGDAGTDDDGYAINVGKTNDPADVSPGTSEEETTKTISASTADSAISTTTGIARETSTNTYKIDDGFLFWNGVTFDFGQNREVASIGAYLDGQAYDKDTAIVSGDAHVNFANKVGGSPDFKWQFFTTAAGFDSSTLKRETITEPITCKNDSDGYCEIEKVIDLTGYTSSFKDWNIDDIKSGRYAFYMVLDGFKADADHNQEFGDLYARGLGPFFWRGQNFGLLV